MSRDYSVPSVVTSARILDWLRDRRASLSQVCHALGLSKSSTFAILKTLQRAGLVGYEARSKQYFLGVRLLSLGEAAARQLDHLEICRPLLAELVEETRLTGIVAQRADDHLVVVHKLEGSAEVRATMSIGQVIPPGVSAMGKVLAAFTGPERLGPGGASPALERVRRVGYSTSFEEYRQGASAVAAPVFDHRGELALVISLIGFASSLPPGVAETFGERVRDRCAEASRALGINLASGSSLQAEAGA